MTRLSAWLYRVRHRRALATQRVLTALSKGDGYGLGLMRDAHVGADPLHPILGRLMREGLVVSYWEKIDEADAGRPRRRLYRLTLAGWSRIGRGWWQDHAVPTQPRQP
jgi:DNA-binding PadR family transcriptional regulator